MNFNKLALIILLLSIVSVFADSFESIESSSSSSTLIDCDSLYSESEDDDLLSFITRNNLQHDYERRDDSFEACLQFLDKFITKIDQYRNEEGKQDDLKLGHLKQQNKRASKMKILKNRFHHKY
jgi:hypothetical protein